MDRTIRNGLMFGLAAAAFALAVAGCSGPGFTKNKVGGMDVWVAVSPDPPRVGHNVLKIRLTDSSGKAIKDARLAVAAVMPAMPSMGMPEMRVQAEVAAADGGFEAPLHLGMEGNWTVTLDINSRELAAKLEYVLTTGSKGLSLRSSPQEGHSGHGTPVSDEKFINISPDKQQLIGVKTGTAKRERFIKEIKTAGRIAHDPELYSAQTEFIAALSSGSDDLISSARTRLEILGMSKKEISELSGTGKADEDLLVPGKKAWLYASVYEYEVPYIKVGQKVLVTTPSLPGKEFHGRLVSITPIIEAETRTAKIRAELREVPDDLLHQMFVNAVIKADLGLKLMVPRDAVLDSGDRQIIFVDKGGGYFEPRLVRTGLRNDQSIEILSGISDGEKIVISGNFLIDAESRLKSVLPEGHQH